MEVTPYDNGHEKVSQVQTMFDKIAPVYDRLNRIISLGMDVSWRRKAIRLLEPYQPKSVLDVATGTGDFAIDQLKRIPSIEHILGVDISEEMMRLGEDKVRMLGLQERITFQAQDCAALPFSDNSFDAATIGFGIRNFSNIPQAVRELYRVLRPGKPLIILELTEPKHPILYRGYQLYVRYVIPQIGKWLSRDHAAYSYLPRSIHAAPQRDAMVSILLEAGFNEAYYHSIAPGTCCIYVAVK